MKGTNTDFPLHSVSEINKRTFQLALTAVALGGLMFAVYAFLGLYYIAFLVAAFCCCISFILFLNSKSIIKNTKFPLVVFASLALIVLAADEGYQTAVYLYYFPLIIAIPVIVENQKTYFGKVILYFAISSLCCVACVAIGLLHRPWHPLNAQEITQVFFINVVSAVIATTGFAYLNIHLERKYLKVLIDQKNNTINNRTQFLSTMGHELRTPLNGIIGAVNLLKKTESLPVQQEYFNILKYCSDQMLYQVNDILDFNKIEAGKLEIHPVAINLKQLLTNAIMPFANLFKENGLKLLLEIDPKLDKFLLVDDVRIIQILNNLLSNAGKFTNHGHIKLSAVVLQNTDVFRVKFSVEDTGIGIDEKDQKLVFDSFGQVFDANTRKITGSGLGLTICNEILELMDSKMELQSQKNVGSTFSFIISFEVPDKQIFTELPAVQNSNLSGTKILLVEDNQINMLIAQKMLDSLKATCIKAYNGEEALKVLEENSAAFNIVLMDLEMPVMDGYTAIRTIKHNWPHIPVLAFTATMMDAETLTSLQNIGFDDCVLKPFQASVLLDQVKKYALLTDINLQ
ncbi:MAG: response regulator [Sphingobacteriaceae bacterium]|nr:MAG: response regulator [Sphingobacteriaceae bacterium]